MTASIHPLAQLSSSSSSLHLIPPPHPSSMTTTATMTTSSTTSCHPPSPTLIPSTTSDVITPSSDTIINDHDLLSHHQQEQHTNHYNNSSSQLTTDSLDLYDNTSQEQPTRPASSAPTYHQQRAYSVTAMPSDLQKTVLRHQQKQQEQQQRLMQDQPWWQYYYQRYHYHPPPGRKPTVFGPYLLLQTLGEGEFGKVKLGIHIESGHEVAIKLIKRDNIDSSTRMTKVEREISVLRTVRHPYIVKLYDVIETEKYIGIILQCASGGELFEYILAHRYLKEKDASRLFAQLISGVHYMHQKHIVHRDLKLENLLLDRHRSIIITDFGFANQFSSARDDLMSTSCGSPCYAAPELVISEGLYVGSAVDIWSCGVILYAMLCGYLPFDDDPANPDGDNINLLYKYILNTPLAFPDYVSADARDLLRRMLVPDPAKRCSMEIIMSHPWLYPHRHLFGKSVHELELEAMRSSDLPIHMVISNHHQHQQLLLQQQQQQQQQQQRQNVTKDQNNRRNTIGTEYTLPMDDDNHHNTNHKNDKDENDQVVPTKDLPHQMDIDEMPAELDHDLANDPTAKDDAEEKTHNHQDTNPIDQDATTPMQEITAFELPTLATPVQPETDKEDAIVPTDEATHSDSMDTDQVPSEQQVEETSIKEQQPTIIVEKTASTTEKSKSKQQEEEEAEKRLEQEEAASAVPELPQPSPSPSKRQSTSTDRLLHFLSGGNNSPTPKVSRHLSTGAYSQSQNQQNQQQRRPMSLLGDSSAGSILQAKFLSSMQRQSQRRSSKGHKTNTSKHQNGEDEDTLMASPSASLSASHIPTSSTPLSSLSSSSSFFSSSKNNNSHSMSFTAAGGMGASVTTSNTSSSIRLSPHNRTTPQPGTSSPARGTRRKALSLLVNSMTDYIGTEEQQQQQKRSNKKTMVFSRRSHQQQDEIKPSPPPKVIVTKERKSGDVLTTSTPLLPSVSEHTTIAMANKEKHRSAGKKLMDWFKKKPISTKDRNMNGPDKFTHNNANNKLLSKLPLGSYAVDFNDAKLRNHHGAVDQDALTARPPQEVLQQIKQTLTVTMGMEIKRDGGDYKLKCTRKKRTTANKNDSKHENTPTPSSSNRPAQQAPFRRILMRKSSEQQEVSSSSSSSSSSTPALTSNFTYGDPALDPGDEVRFSVELCKIKNLPGLYIVDIRRLRGNLWSYKFLYHALLEQLNLSGNGGYISNHPPHPDSNDSNHRISVISSGAGSSVVLEETEPAQEIVV